MYMGYYSKSYLEKTYVLCTGMPNDLEFNFDLRKKKCCCLEKIGMPFDFSIEFYLFSCSVCQHLVERLCPVGFYS